MLSETYKNHFFEFLNFLTANKIKYFLICGTLLGAVRDHNFIEGDDDVDIGLYIEDYDKVKNLIINSGKYVIHFLWRREIGIIKAGSTSKESKIDLFFLDKDDKNYYLYSYKSNKLTGKWDVEWRRKFNKSCFEELISYKFLGKQVSIPKNYEEVLTTHYGNWQVKDPTWNNSDIDSIDKNWREIAIVVNTFMRDEALKAFIKSVEAIYPNDWYKFYIADQGFTNIEKDKYYNTLKQKGHFVTYLPFNCGLSFARNYLVSRVIEPFIFIVDDDFEFTNKTNPSNFIRILLHDPSIGVVGGQLENHENYTYNLELNKTQGSLHYCPVNKKTINYTRSTHLQTSIPYFLSDIVLNFALFRTEVFKDIKWDDQLKLSEHTDFYLRFKNTLWKVSFTDAVTAIHKKDRHDEIYRKLRGETNSDLGKNLFLKKWGLKEGNVFYIKGDK